MSNTESSPGPEPLDRALAGLDVEDAADLVARLVQTPSATGSELALARLLESRLSSKGITAQVQRIGPEAANVVVGAEADGRPRLLLYGQLDTTLTGTPELDRSLIGGETAAEFVPVARRQGDWVIGMGAENPKGYLAATILALEALAAQSMPGNVQLVAGLCGGGMPAFGPPHEPAAPAGDGPLLGFGHGCRALLASIAPVSAALVPKPGFAVSFEEVGIACFRIVVGGRFGYTGIRTGSKSENTVAVTAHIVTALETWFDEYSERFATTYTRPRGAVVAVRGGDPNRPAFWPQTSEIYVDLRLPPGIPSEEPAAALREQVSRLAETYAVSATVECLFSIDGAKTSPDAPIVRAAVTAWEDMSGTRHQARTGTSGYTDTSTLRHAGIDTARIGMPRPPQAPGGPVFSMGAVHLPSLLVLASWLIRTVAIVDAGG